MNAKRSVRHEEHPFRQLDRICPIRSIIPPPRSGVWLATAIIRDYPEYYPLYSMKEFRYNNITQANRNRLLWSDPAVDA